MWKMRLPDPCVIFTLVLPLTPCCGASNQPLAADAAPLVAEAGAVDGLTAADAAKDASVAGSGTSTAVATATGGASDTATDTDSATGTGTASKTATVTGSATASATDAGTASKTATGTGTGSATASVTDAGTASKTATDTGTGAATSTDTNRCAAAGLVWKTANKTEFTSYPAAGSEECIKYSGCLYEGMFAGCGPTMPVSWVQSHDIVSVFPDFATLKHHDLCLKSGAKTMVVLAIDMCADSDCSGCCTQNKGSANELIDIESYTAARFGVPDGPIQWADLGPTKGDDCPP
jgi:hypothetical protein